jgi:hypothetical protein
LNEELIQVRRRLENEQEKFVDEKGISRSHVVNMSAIHMYIHLFIKRSSVVHSKAMLSVSFPVACDVKSKGTSSPVTVYTNAFMFMVDDLG